MMARRIQLGVLLLLIAIAIGLGLSLALKPGSPDVAGFGQPDIGGPFDLIDDHGVVRHDSDFRGKLMLVYFGYTHCPDVCPTSLQTMSDSLAKLGQNANQVVPIFVTIDPQRDTQHYLEGYAEQFDARFVSLTGDPTAVESVEKAYKVYAAKGPSDVKDPKGYLMNHSSFIYLMGRDGKFLTVFGPDIAPDAIAAGIKNYL